MVRQPRVSVIIPCFNLGRYLEEAVDSVLAQTFQDFEIIIVNDGSTDEMTNTLLADFKRPRTQVLFTEHRGLPAARNLAIEESRGRYISALDADDKFHPLFLEKTISLLEANPSVAFVSTWIEIFGSENWIWRQESCDFPKLLAECVVLTASPVRREAIEAVGGYDSRLFSEGDEDWDLWISLVEKGFCGTIVPEVLFFYRRRPGSMSTVCTQGETRMRLWGNMLEKHRDSYLRYLPEVLLLKEIECGNKLLSNWRLEDEIERRLRPEVADLRKEREELKARFEGAGRNGSGPVADSFSNAQRDLLVHQVAELTRAAEAAHKEIAALRSSRSWKITAPLRRSYDYWLSLKGLPDRG